MDAPIRYKVIYEDDDGGLVKEGEFSATNPGVTIDDSGPAPASVVLDIITYVEIFQQKYAETARESWVETSGEEKNRFKIRKVRFSEMVIRSQTLVEALRKVVKYYPKQAIEKDKIVLPEPYFYILHNMRDLEKYVEEREDASELKAVENLGEQTAPRNFRIAPVLRNHFQVLKDFVDKTWGRKIERELERYRQTPPMATFEMLWMLFSPGTKVVFAAFRGDSPHRMGGIVRRCERETELGVDIYKLSMWSLDIFRQPKNIYISRRKHSWNIREFPGEREIRHLPVYPIDLLVDGKLKALNPEIREELEQRGTRYFELMKDVLDKGSLEVTYSGELLGDTKLKNYSGNAILDPSAYVTSNNNSLPYGKVMDLDPQVQTDEGENLVTPTEKPKVWWNYDDINDASLKSNIIKLDKLHFFLSPPQINGFALRRKEFFGFRVDSIESLTVNKGVLKTLQIPQDRLEMITALTHRFDGNSKSWSADFIESKGEGLLFLLHGPSGVGKTYTAECIAMYSGRPLLALTVSDIGTEEGDMESKLAKWFNLAETWGAIMLIDEADVYFERRASGQLQRNSLVSAFLRSMEYYRGILFLTTNRLGHIDDAIISRIHLIIEYKDLTDVARIKIWKQFFTKLSKDRPNYAVDPYLEGFVENDVKITSLKWNGREIRNAFQTAVALAEYSAKTEEPAQEKIIVKKGHLEGVAEMSAVFKKYMKDFKGDAEKRAYIEGARMDDGVRQKKLQVEQARKLARQGQGRE